MNTEPLHSSPARHERTEDLPALAHQIRDMIKESRRPVILTHANPDADAVSSALGMRFLCKHFGIDPEMVASGDAALPENLRFLQGATDLTLLDDDKVIGADLVILVDCSDPARLGPLYYRMSSEFERHRPMINIDHHVTNSRFGTLNLVLPSAASTAEMVVALFDANDVEIEPYEATSLLAGIYGDTLGLRTPSTTPSTMRVCAELIEDGADLDTVVDHLFRLKPYSTICLWAEVLQRTQWRDSLIWTQVDGDMLERTGADRTEAEGIVNFLAGTVGARAAALLYQESWGWRVSMRTLDDDVNVADLLGRHGGGGHPRAAGTRLPAGDEAREHFLNDIAAILGPRVPAVTVRSRSDDPI